MGNNRDDFQIIFDHKNGRTESFIKVILEKINKEKFFDSVKTFPTISNPTSTATRVLLSDGIYEEFKDVYEVTYALHEFIYDIYSRDDDKYKDIDPSIYNDSDFSFNEFFRENRPVKSLFWQSSFWQYDSQYEVLRKESVKKVERKGRYYEKELVHDPNTLTNKPYQKAETIHPTHAFNDRSEDNNERYNWIFGKYDFSDDYFIRFYWNIYPDKKIIARFLEALQLCFDTSRIPFQFKFLSSISDYKRRSDTAVLYLPRKHVLICMELVRNIYNQFRNEFFFAKNVPMFTYKLEEGLSFGENPDDRRYTSFGSYRAIHIAMAIVKVFKDIKPLPDSEELLVKIKKSLNGKNENWTKQFYVNEFSSSDYFQEFRFFEVTKGPNSHFRELKTTNLENLSVSNYSPNENQEKRKERYLSTSVQIANILCKEAIWYNTNDASELERYPLNCNWISFRQTIPDSSLENIAYQFNTLSETFIEGRLGVSFFLKQVHSVNQNETFYRTSYRALEGALKLIPENPGDTYIDELGWVIHKMKDSKTEDLFGFKETLELIDKRKHLETEFKAIIKWESDAWREPVFKHLIESVVSTQKDFLTEKETAIVDRLLADYFDVERPFGNALGTDEFCATIKDGYALLGYFFLRLYDPKSFEPLPFIFT